MKKPEFIEKLSTDIGVTKKAATEMVDNVFGCLREVLVTGEEFTIQSFGSFKLIEKPEHIARNPRTGEEVKIPTKKVLKFKASTDLKNDIAKIKM